MTPITHRHGIAGTETPLVYFTQVVWAEVNKLVVVYSEQWTSSETDCGNLWMQMKAACLMG